MAQKKGLGTITFFNIRGAGLGLETVLVGTC